VIEYPEPWQQYAAEDWPRLEWAKTALDPTKM